MTAEIEASSLAVVGSSTGDLPAGWSYVLGLDTRPTTRASLYKVAHHGSRTGEHDGLWTDLLMSDPVAVLTPFRRDSVDLPTDADILRLRDRAGSVHITSRGRGRLQRLERVVERELRERFRSVRGAHLGFGHIRARAPERLREPRPDARGHQSAASDDPYGIRQPR